MLEVATTLRAEREQREATEFIEVFKGLSDMEKAEVRGYMNCLRTIRILTDTKPTTEVQRA